MNVADELQKLEELHQSGAINDDEFALAKAKLLNGRPEVQPVAAAPSEATGVSPAAQEQQTRRWGLFVHLSVLAGFLVPLAGLVVPIVIWQLKKAELPGIDAHCIEYIAKPGSEISRKQLKDIHFPHDAIVGAVLHDDAVVIPKGDTKIQEGDRVVVFSLPHAIDEVEKLFK